MSGALFSLQNLTLAGSQAPRLNSVTLHVPQGLTAIVGLSGAGKTTLLNVLAGFETGFTGQMTSNTSADYLSHRLPLFWVPQNGGLWPHLSAEQHLEVVRNQSAGTQKSGTESGHFLERTDETLRLFDLTHRRRALPAELSQGERSRLALARALTTRATVLLLDEPLGHVDPVRKPEYWKIVQSVVAKENISMVFSSHEPETVLRQAEHVICLRDGEVACEGSVKTLYHDPPDAHVGAFLGPLNWFRADEASLLLPDYTPVTDVAIRPERLQICKADDSGIELIATPFVGTCQESIVRHVASGMTTSVLHQVPEEWPSIGQRISFHLRPQSGGTP